MPFEGALPISGILVMGLSFLSEFITMETLFPAKKRKPEIELVAQNIFNVRNA